MSERIYGIDLGTTNSCLAVMDPGGPRAVAIDGDPIVPSVVSFDGDRGEIVVGRRARNRRLLAPESTIQSIKRRMGSQETIRLGGEDRAPEAIAAEILRYLKVEGEKAEGREIRRAVITVPAYFEDAQRRATLRAGELAGLEVVRLINEPTAAALVYDRLEVRGGRDTAAVAGRRHAAEERERILVYDLGGGTFDVSVVEIRGELNEVRASCGDNHLGGDDFDELIVGHLLEHLRERTGRDLSPDLHVMARLRAAAESAKIELSSQPYSRVMEEALAGDVHLDVELDRATLEELLEESLEGTLTEVDRALEEARLGADQIDRVVLVGGSTRIPRVIEMLGERFGGPVEHSIDPALCVALGAALQGALLGGEIFDHILVDVAAHSLGILTLGVDGVSGSILEPDRFSKIIRRNTQIPVTRSEVFCTIVDGQKLYKAEVYQGEHRRCADNTLIGEFPFELEPVPAGSPLVVEFCYDLDGIVRVRVHQKGTDNRKEVTLDTRRRPAAAADSDDVLGDVSAVDNYIIRKGRKLCTDLPDGALRERLRAAADAYEAALAAEAADLAEVDALEDELLELIEAAEETDAAAETEEVAHTGEP